VREDTRSRPARRHGSRETAVERVLDEAGWDPSTVVAHGPEAALLRGGEDSLVDTLDPDVDDDGGPGGRVP
jgi:hypothetical protein